MALVRFFRGLDVEADTGAEAEANGELGALGIVFVFFFNRDCERVLVTLLASSSSSTGGSSAFSSAAAASSRLRVERLRFRGRGDDVIDGSEEASDSTGGSKHLRRSHEMSWSLCIVESARNLARLVSV